MLIYSYSKYLLYILNTFLKRSKEDKLKTCWKQFAAKTTRCKIQITQFKSEVCLHYFRLEMYFFSVLWHLKPVTRFFWKNRLCWPNMWTRPFLHIVVTNEETTKT